MLKYLVALLCGMSLSGSVYMAGWGSQVQGDRACANDDRCHPPQAQMMAVASDHSDKIDVKNTQCIVTGDAVGESTATVEYQGKVYHLCCGDCVKDFQAVPEKYIKALEANPAKFGVKSRP